MIFDRTLFCNNYILFLFVFVSFSLDDRHFSGKMRCLCLAQWHSMCGPHQYTASLASFTWNVCFRGCLCVTLFSEILCFLLCFFSPLVEFQRGGEWLVFVVVCVTCFSNSWMYSLHNWLFWNITCLNVIYMSLYPYFCLLACPIFLWSK